MLCKKNCCLYPISPGIEARTLQPTYLTIPDTFATVEFLRRWQDQLAAYQAPVFWAAFVLLFVYRKDLQDPVYYSDN